MRLERAGTEVLRRLRSASYAVCEAFSRATSPARYEGSSPRECLAYGVACGAQSTQHFGAGTLEPHEVARIASRVNVSEIDVSAGVA